MCSLRASLGRKLLAHKLSKEEGQIDWQRPAVELARQIRGLNPWPVAYSQIQGETVRIWHAHVATAQQNQAPGTIVAADKQGIAVQTGAGLLVLTELQLPGGKALPVRDILNSRAAWFAPGEHFGAASAAGTSP